MSVNDVNVYFGGLFYSVFFIKLEMSTNLVYNLFWYCLDLTVNTWEIASISWMYLF